jgi:hypothetical protein
MKIVRFTTRILVISLLMMLAAYMGGVGSMVCNFAVGLALAVLAGSRVEDSVQPIGTG